MPTERSFPRSARLLRAADFAPVFRHGERVQSPHFTLIVLRAPGPARLGLAVARRQLPSAVERNRVKRLARESFRSLRPGLPDADFVLMARPGAARQSRVLLRTELDELLQRAARKLEARSRSLPRPPSVPPSRPRPIEPS